MIARVLRWLRASRLEAEIRNCDETLSDIAELREHCDAIEPMLIERRQRAQEALYYAKRRGAA